jgi:hypothetical protein
MTVAPDDVSIAGSKKIRHWKAFRSKLKPGGDQNLWKEAFSEYFHPRVNLRYLLPVETLRKYDSLRGEGFSITAIQCSLIEFLESTVRGISYRYLKKGEKLREYEYCKSKEVFVNFLTKRQPFANTFSQEVAEDFYEGVRCGLLHGAQTKNGWIIRGKGRSGKLICTEEKTRKIVYRDEFQNGLLKFVKWYGQALPLDASLQEAFIRKFDSLCQ